MANVYIGGTCFGTRLKSGAKFVAITSIVKSIQHAPDGTPHDIERNFRPVFRPIGFHDPNRGGFALQNKTRLGPEFLSDRPGFIGRRSHYQPTLLACAFDARAVDLWKHRSAGRWCGTTLAAIG